MADAKNPVAFADRFRAAIDRLGLHGKHIVVAFSGGLDSTLLLHLLHRSDAPASLSAVHVDHGLHEDSGAWSAHCARVAETLAIPFVSRKVSVERASGQSLEADAREARYAALADVIGRDQVVVTAHHADDQLETVLLRLVRGAGVRGLTAIHQDGPFGAGRLARPLLEFTRTEIEAEARRLGLVWLEDPSNEDQSFDRNFLRARVLPLLRERWPGSDRTAGRLARQMAEAERVLADAAAADLAGCDELDRIPTGILATLPEHRLNNALRHAIRANGLPVPNSTQLAEIRRMLPARSDAEVAVSWPGAEARIYRQQLYLLPPSKPGPGEEGRVDPGAAFAFDEGEIGLVAAASYGIPDAWARAGLEVRFRAGGERFRPRGSAHHKSLKQWFQENGIVPWMRSRVPLLYHDDRIVAVADICLADLPRDAADGPFWQPTWRGHARLY